MPQIRWLPGIGPGCRCFMADGGLRPAGTGFEGFSGGSPGTMATVCLGAVAWVRRLLLDETLAESRRVPLRTLVSRGRRAGVQSPARDWARRRNALDATCPDGRPFDGFSPRGRARCSPGPWRTRGVMDGGNPCGMFGLLRPWGAAGGWPLANSIQEAARALLPGSAPVRYGGRPRMLRCGSWGLDRVPADSPRDAGRFQRLNAGSNGGSGRGGREPHRPPAGPGRNGADPAHWPRLRSSRRTNPAPQTNPARTGTVQQISRQPESRRSRPSCPCFARFSSALLPGLRRPSGFEWALIHALTFRVLRDPSPTISAIAC